MFKKVILSKIIPVFAVAAVSVFFPVMYFSGVAYAESEISGCTGKITGTTILKNVNAGKTSFDAHFDAHGENAKPADVSITGLGTSGLAPVNYEYAACTESKMGTFDGRNYEYALKGWAWNDNIGFISFNCTSGKNDAGIEVGVSCGSYDYGVYVSEDLGGGKRELFGYAWSPTFGYIQFNDSEAAKTVASSSKVITESSFVKEILGGVVYKLTLTSVDSGTGKASVNLNGTSKTGLISPSTTTIGDVKLNISSIVKTGTKSITSTLSKDIPAITYKVVKAADGDLSGYAWTSAGLYLNFGGAKLYLPGEEAAEAEDEAAAGGDFDATCEHAPWVSVCVEPNPAILRSGTIGFGTGANNEIKIADGNDGYYVHMYLHDASGNPINSADYFNYDQFINGINFSWNDTVKRDQLPVPTVRNQVGDSLKDVQNPWNATSGKGAVTFKPLTFNLTDFELVEEGHYKTKFKVASYGPTLEGNISYTASTDPVFTVKNERPVYYPNIQNALEPNQLILEAIQFQNPLRLNDASHTVVFNGAPIYPNNRLGLFFKFRPAIEVGTLYVNDYQDRITGYRSIPENVTIGFNTYGNVGADTVASAAVNLKLAYDDAETENVGNCGDPGDPNPVFDFVFYGQGDSVHYPVNSGNTAGVFDAQIIAQLPAGGSAGAVDIGAGADTGTGTDADAVLPCDTAVAPNLHSEVSYNVGGKDIKYLSNHLPRIAEEAIFNPVAVIHGTVLSQLVGNVQEGKAVDTSGYVNVNIVRDTINQNLKKYLGDVSGLSAGGECTVTGLAASATVTGCSAGDYKSFKVGNENILYFKGRDVVMALSDGTPDGTWQNEWVIISDGGNIFVNKDIYNPDGGGGARLSLVTFRGEGDDFFGAGHVYIAPCNNGFDVRNVQATIVADGTLFSYNGNSSLINDKGEPTWGGYNEMVNALSCQLKMDAAIYSDNTIGGADLDRGSRPKNYLLIGGGDKISVGDGLSVAERMRAQMYDLNYLRMFRMAIAVTAQGLPVDQKCLKGLTPEDITNIASEETLCGDRPAAGDSGPVCSEAGSVWQSYACDGINPTKRYNPTHIPGGNAGPDGDLVAPTDIDNRLAHGLDSASDFDPVYVFYKAPKSGSFLFSKKGSLNAGD